MQRNLSEREQIIEIVQNFPTMRRFLNYEATNSAGRLAAEKIVQEFTEAAQLPE